MDNKAATPKNSNFGWSTFKVPPGGSSQDIRKGAVSIKSQVERERKVFGDASLLNGGTKVKA